MIDRKKILIIDNLAVESSRRGVYRLLAQRPELEVHLFVPRQWKETTGAVVCEAEPTARLHLHTSGILFGFRHHRVIYTSLFQVIRKLQPAFVLAVHAPENYATLQLLAARVFVLSSLRVGLFASRNIDLPSIGFPYKLAFLNTMCDWMTSKAGVDIVYHRPKECGYLYRRYTPRTVYIPHHVDCSIFTPDASTKRDQTSVTLGYVGRLTQEKGVHILIEAMTSLPAHVRLIVVGEGPYRVHLEARSRSLGIADRVNFESLVRYDAMPQLLNRLDVLVQPSLETPQWKELFGRILIEAMACAVPVVASRSGGIPEVVGNAGVLVEAGSVVALSEHLSELVANTMKRQQLGQRGRERVLELFDTTLVAETLGCDINRETSVQSPIYPNH